LKAVIYQINNSSRTVALAANSNKRPYFIDESYFFDIVSLKLKNYFI